MQWCLLTSVSNKKGSGWKLKTKVVTIHHIKRSINAIETVVMEA